MTKRGHFPCATLLAVAILNGGAPALARNETQYWISQSATMKLDAITTLTLDGSERFNDTSSTRDQYLYRVTLDRRVANGVEVGGGFVWSRVGKVDEYRPFGEATFSQGVLAFRNRLEPRMFDNADRTVWRLREKLQLSLPLDADMRWTGVVNGEGFFNLNRANVAQQTGLTMFRSLVGVRRTLGKTLSLSLSYQYQRTLVSGGEDIVTHQPIVALAARF